MCPIFVENICTFRFTHKAKENKNIRISLRCNYKVWQSSSNHDYDSKIFDFLLQVYVQKKANKGYYILILPFRMIFMAPKNQIE